MDYNIKTLWDLLFLYFSENLLQIFTILIQAALQTFQLSVDVAASIITLKYVAH